MGVVCSETSSSIPSDVDRLAHYMKCQTSHGLRIIHCSNATANQLDIFQFAANSNWLGIGPTAAVGHVYCRPYHSD